jgi:hypothetical protein
MFARKADMGKTREAIRHRLEIDKCSKRLDANACDLGKGEVVSSILTGSTILVCAFIWLMFA